MGAILILIGGVLAGMNFGKKCCAHTEQECKVQGQQCKDNKAKFGSSSYHSWAGIECEDYDTICSNVVMMITIGVALIITGTIIASVFACGICACCCFEAKTPPAQAQAGGGVVYGQPVTGEAVCGGKDNS